MSSGRISLLVSKELQTLLSAIRTLPAEVNAVIRRSTKTEAEPMWREAVRGNVTTRLETRVLSDTARVAVTDSNVLLRSGTVGQLGNGTPIPVVAAATEYGADPTKQIMSRSKAGNPYTRRRGRQFKLPRTGGHVVGPAARNVIPRIGRLWFQIAVRTTHEKFEEGGAS